MTPLSLPCSVRYSTIFHTTMGIPFLLSPCCWSSRRLTPNTFGQVVSLCLFSESTAVFFMSSFNLTADLLCLKEQRGKKPKRALVTFAAEGCVVTKQAHPSKLAFMLQHNGLAPLSSNPQEKTSVK